MAAHQLIAPLPFVSLEAGYTITVEAIDPSSGAAVTGVTVSEVAILATNSAPGFAGDLEDDSPYTTTAET